MNPLVAVAVALLPDLVKLIAGDKAGTFSEKVVAAVKAATNRDEQALAQEVIDNNPAAKAKLQTELAQIALEATKEQNRVEEEKRASELDELKLQFEEAAREREDDINRFREELKATENAQAFYTEIAKTGGGLAWVNPTLSLLIVLGFMSLVFLLWLYPQEANKDNQVFNIALGALATAFATVVGFHFGSSLGSKEKDRVNSALVTHQAIRLDDQRAEPAPVSQKPTLKEPVSVPRSSGGGGTGLELFNSKAPVLMRLLMKEFGLTDFQAGGVLGNIGWECDGFREYQERGQTPPRGGWGICQWTASRRRDFVKWADDRSLDHKSDEANFGFLVHELKTSEARALRLLKETTSLEDATESFMKSFLRPGVPHLSGRLVWAKRAMAAFR